MTNDELRALASKAPEGLWEVSVVGAGFEIEAKIGDEWRCIIQAQQFIPRDQDPLQVKRKALAAYTAAASPETVIKLLDRIAELEKQLEAK